MIRRTIALAILAILAATGAFAQTPTVPVDHSVYPFLARMEAKGLISGYFDAALPLDRGQVGDILVEVEKKCRDKYYGTFFTKVDLDRLKYFWFEFWDVIPYPGSGDYGWTTVSRTSRRDWIRFGNFWRNSHDWFSGAGDSYSWAANPILRYDFVSDDRYDKTIQRRTSGIDFRAAWNGKLGIFFRFHDTKEWGNGPYRSRNQVYDDRYGYIGPLLGDDFTYYDRADYGIHLKWGRFRLEGGKWQNIWGPGHWGHFLLSDEATSYDQVRFRFDIGKWGQFTALTGALHQYPPLDDTLYISSAGDARLVESQKFVSAHRIDVKPWHVLQVGLSEMVIYGGRGLELGYLLPLNLYFSAQHHYGDQDNMVMAADFKYVGIRGVRCYGELLIDDLTIAKLGTNFYGNKWAGLLGAWWVDPIGAPNLSVGLEFAAVRPYVGTHRFVEDLPTHWTRPLGYPAPPNSLTWTIGGDYQPIRSLSLSLRYVYQKHGANPDGLNVGGDANLPHRPEDPEMVAFLAGDLQTSQSWSAAAGWEPLPRLKLQLAGGGTSGDTGDFNWMRAGFYLYF